MSQNLLRYNVPWWQALSHKIGIISQNHQVIFYHFNWCPNFCVMLYIYYIFVLPLWHYFRLNQEGSVILPSEKLGRITRFGVKFIVVHQPHLRIWGEDILVTITLWLSLILNSPFMYLLFLKLQSNIIMMY